jgi:zinc finger protein
MATNCDACGHKTNEVKSSGGIEPTGVRIEIHIKDAIDLKRDVLKVNLYFIFQNTLTR